MSMANALAFILIGWSACGLAWAFVPGSPPAPLWLRVFGATLAAFMVLAALAEVVQ